MPTAQQIEQLAGIAAKRLGGNLRLLGIYGSAADQPDQAHDIDFLLVVDAVENCVAIATSECRALYPRVQFFVLTAAEFAVLPGFFRFQFAFAKKLSGDLYLPAPTVVDAIESITHGYTDTLRTLRQQFKRREWVAADDWAKQCWWNLKSFKYATLDVCWILRQERPSDIDRAAVILKAAGLDQAARALEEWPELEVAARQLTHDPVLWISRWELVISGAYSEARKVIQTSKR
jgi:hypothetical protein